MPPSTHRKNRTPDKGKNDDANNTTSVCGWKYFLAFIVVAVLILHQLRESMVSINGLTQTTSGYNSGGSSVSLPAAIRNGTYAKLSLSAGEICVSEKITNSTTDANRRQRRPILYLHPGPPKTATTTIQILLRDHQADLARDHIFYLGKTIPRDKWTCGLDHPANCPMYKQYAERSEGKTEPDCMDRMKLQLGAYYAAGVDVVLSDEVIGIMFSDVHPQHRKRAPMGIREFF